MALLARLLSTRWSIMGEKKQFVNPKSDWQSIPFVPFFVLGIPRRDVRSHYFVDYKLSSFFFLQCATFRTVDENPVLFLFSCSYTTYSFFFIVALPHRHLHHSAVIISAFITASGLDGCPTKMDLHNNCDHRDRRRHRDDDDSLRFVYHRG
jgi:hypothetical protein